MTTSRKKFGLDPEASLPRASPFVEAVSAASPACPASAASPALAGRGASEMTVAPATPCGDAGSARHPIGRHCPLAALAYDSASGRSTAWGSAARSHHSTRKTSVPVAAASAVNLEAHWVLWIVEQRSASMSKPSAEHEALYMSQQDGQIMEPAIAISSAALQVVRPSSTPSASNRRHDKVSPRSSGPGGGERGLRTSSTGRVPTSWHHGSMRCPLPQPLPEPWCAACKISSCITGKPQAQHRALSARRRAAIALEAHRPSARTQR
mmetsp:Transcript_111254/g.321694  ORF Transcript_111254/g.321694 Transcript_111254/m.321694 type:complete len:266 (-) Transcript_111254:13-810(-)